MSNTRKGVIRGTINVTCDRDTAVVGDRLTGSLEIKLEEPVQDPQLFVVLRCRELIMIRKGLSSQEGRNTRSKVKISLSTGKTEVLRLGLHNYSFEIDIPGGILPVFHADVDSKGTVSVIYELGGRLESYNTRLSVYKPLKLFNDLYPIDNGLLPHSIETVFDSISRTCKCCKKAKGSLLFSMDKSVYRLNEPMKLEVSYDLKRFSVGIKLVTLSFYRSLSYYANTKKIDKAEHLKLLKQEIVIRDIQPYAQFNSIHLAYDLDEVIQDLVYSVHTDLIKCQFFVQLDIKTKFHLFRSAKFPPIQLWFTISPPCLDYISRLP